MNWPSQAEIEELARKVASVSYSRMLTWSQRYEAAYDGVIDGIATGVPDVKRHALIAVTAAQEKEKQQHGIPDAHPTGSRTGANFATYWHGRTSPDFAETFADRIIENTAICQVYDQLPERHQGTISAIIYARGNVGKAAETLGVPYPTFASRLKTARDVARDLWFDTEPDSGHYAKAYTTQPGQAEDRHGRHRRARTPQQKAS